MKNLLISAIILLTATACSPFDPQLEGKYYLSDQSSSDACVIDQESANMNKWLFRIESHEVDGDKQYRLVTHPSFGIVEVSELVPYVGDSSSMLFELTKYTNSYGMRNSVTAKFTVTNNTGVARSLMLNEFSVVRNMYGKVEVIKPLGRLMKASNRKSSDKGMCVVKEAV